MKFKNRTAKTLFSEANDVVRDLVERMVLVVENENPERVSNREAVDIAAGFEREYFNEMLRQAINIVTLDIDYIRSNED